LVVRDGYRSFACNKPIEDSSEKGSNKLAEHVDVEVPRSFVDMRCDCEERIKMAVGDLGAEGETG
jgi:hypothetical protein